MTSHVPADSTSVSFAGTSLPVPVYGSDCYELSDSDYVTLYMDSLTTFSVGNPGQSARYTELVGMTHYQWSRGFDMWHIDENGLLLRYSVAGRSVHISGHGRAVRASTVRARGVRYDISVTPRPPVDQHGPPNRFDLLGRSLPGAGKVRVSILPADIAKQ
jgi:hypothetical protein